MPEMSKDEQISALQQMNDSLERHNRRLTGHATALKVCKVERRKLAEMQKRVEGGSKVFLCRNKGGFQVLRLFDYPPQNKDGDWEPGLHRDYLTLAVDLFSDIQSGECVQAKIVRCE